MICPMADPLDLEQTAAVSEATVSEDSRPPALGAPAGIAAGTQVAGRFVVNRPLGRGSTGEVLAVQDLSLDREVAMKVLRGAGGPAIARFMREARITARLDHPGVPPVHSLEFLPDGGLLFTMRRLDGTTLGEAVRRTVAGSPPPAIATVNVVISLGLRVCEALSRAHFLGIIHRDVKPDNIMLGGHGEVAVVDWGECRLVDEPDAGPAGSTVGTPAYMSPEQARGEPADARSDIYALGATLYHVLTLRHPTWDDDPARFWDKKRAGVVDPLPADAAARVPRPLLAILHRALYVDPAGRYATVAELAADLERFQAGLAVEAYHESLPERSWRWLRRHRRAVLAATAMVMVCLVAAGLLWREHLRQLADWGPPILVEEFADDSWHQRWFEEEPGMWQLQGGRLVAQGKGRSMLVLDRVLAGAVAIEYEGEMLPGCVAGDLSIVWNEDPEIAPGHTLNEMQRGFMIQAGAFDNYFCAVFRQPDGARLDQRPFRLQSGMRHRFRVEIDGRRIGMWIDGVHTLNAENDLPITTGRLAFYAFYPGKAFDHIRVYQKRLPEVTSVLAIGEAFLRRRLPTEAAEAFREVAESQPGSALAVEARYRQGLALRAADDLQGALRIWQELPAGEQADRVAGHLLDQRVELGRIAEACATLTDLYQRAPAVRVQLRGQWQAWAVKANRTGLVRTDPGAAQALVETKLLLFPKHTGSDLEGGELLSHLGRFSEVVQRFPDEVSPAGLAMCRIGMAEVALRRFGDLPYIAQAARRTLGQFADEIVDPRANPGRRAHALCLMGRAEEVADQSIGFLWQGRPERILAQETPGYRAIALAALGRWDEALAILDDGRHGELSQLHDLLTATPDELAEALAAQQEPLWPDWDSWVCYILIGPIARGDQIQLRQRLDLAYREGRLGAGQRPYHLAAFVLGQTTADDLATAPCAGEAALWQAVGRAVQAELGHDQGAIRQAWQAYLDLPWHQRMTRECLPEVGLETLARWRTTVVERP